MLDSAEPTSNTPLVAAQETTLRVKPLPKEAITIRELAEEQLKDMDSNRPNCARASNAASGQRCRQEVAS